MLLESLFGWQFKACSNLAGEADFVGGCAHEKGIPGRKDLCLRRADHDNGPGMQGGDGEKKFLKKSSRPNLCRFLLRILR